MSAIGSDGLRIRWASTCVGRLNRTLEQFESEVSPIAVQCGEILASASKRQLHETRRRQMCSVYSVTPSFGTDQYFIHQVTVGGAFVLIGDSLDQSRVAASEVIALFFESIAS